MEKGSELPLKHPDRKFKGRYVYQGNQVIDEYHEAALFNELGSSPATLEGSKAVDAFGRLPGHVIEQADASAAYTQALMGTTTPGAKEAQEEAYQVKTQTWVRLPEEARPKLPNGTDKWWAEGIRDPVVPMQKALYGHPDAGGYWERHCEAHLRTCGFVPVTNWPSMFWNDELKCLLMVYVDDFKMSGPPKGLKEAWIRIKKGIETDGPKEVNKCLGCLHRCRTGVLKQSGSTRDSGPGGSTGGVKVNMMEYDETDFMISCVDAYKKACGEPDMKLRPVDSPFISSPDGGG